MVDDMQVNVTEATDKYQQYRKQLQQFRVNKFILRLIEYKAPESKAGSESAPRTNRKILYDIEAIFRNLKLID